VILKFFMIPLLGFAFLFVPNAFFNSFSHVVGVASTCFTVSQAVLLIDFAYSWSERWYSNSLMARQSHPGSGWDKKWQGMILAAAAALLAASIAAAAALFAMAPSTATSVVLTPTLAVGVLLLFTSITEWCEHGSLLASAVVMAYSMWLALEAIATVPGEALHPPWLRVAELLACAGTLAVLASGIASARSVRSPRAVAMAGASEALTGAEGGEIDDVSFLAQCVVHAAASLYICAALVPADDGAEVMFVCRAASLAVALALYGWSLVAPRVLRHRTF